jgi:polyisoprenoid-binding protein YceI
MVRIARTKGSTLSTTAPTQIEGAYTLDPTHSNVGFTVKHMVVGVFRGRFEQVEATLRGGRLEGVVRVDSLDVRDERLAAQLKTPEFFDSARHPELRFASTSLERDGDELVLRGELTIKDHTNPVEARGTITGPLEDPFGNTRLGLSLQTVVDRTQYGLNWNAPLPKGGVALGTEVTLVIDLELVRAEG